MECSNKREQEILIEISLKGEKDKIKEFLENNNLKKSDIDLAIRKCLFKFIKNKINYYECIKELFKQADLNYCNPDFENTNILMAICSKNEASLLDLLFEQKDINNNENKIKLNKSINKNNKENNSYIDIDLFQVDKNNNNVFHHLFNENKIENGIVGIITKIMNYKGNKYLIDKKKNLFTSPNNNGITPIVIILRRGWFDSLCLIFKYIDYQKYIIPCDNNNLIHCAIEGKNIKCIKKILSYCKSTDELKFKNKDGYTPLLYANKFKLFFIEKLIEQTEIYFNNKQIKNAILSIKEDNVYNILEKYILNQNNNYINNNSYSNNIEEIKNNINKDYNLILNNLYKYKINQYILSDDFISLPCEWNILFIKIQFEQILNYINNFKNSSRNINSINISSSLREFSKFFKSELKNFEMNKNKEFMNYSIDIIIYNKIIFYYKIGDYNSLFSTINYYFNNVYQENNNENNYYKYITYVNISFILIEYFLFDNDGDISSIILEQLENYLNKNYPKNSNYNENNIIIKYLNTNEIYNPFNPTWDDTFCYLNLLKALYQIKYNKNLFLNNSNGDNEINDAKKYLKEFKISYNNCNYKEELINFNRLNGLYTICKCYYYYLSNNLSKSLYKISLIKKSLCEYSNEHKIFYFNSLGIINLKLKKYESSEYYFKAGINLFKLINRVNNPNDDLLFYKTEYLIKMKYNLCLALFYNKKYYDAFLICDEIKNLDIIKNNTFFWYRYGITALNLYLMLIKKINKNKQKEKEEKYCKFDKIKSIVNNGINKNNSDSNSSDSKKDKDELYMEFEKEYGNKNKLNNTNSCSNENINFSKKLFLETMCSRPCNRHSKVSNPNSKAENKEVFNMFKYLKISINCFKKAIILYKKPQFVIKRNKTMLGDIKSILDFYIKNGEDEENKDINKILSNESESIYNFNESNISENSLFISCYMNLLFALSLNENFSEILILIKSFPSSIIENNIHIKEKLNYYKINSLINLSKYKDAEELIQNDKNESKENENKINSENQIIDCYNTNNNEIIAKMNHNSYFSLAEIFLNVKLKKYEDAENYLQKIIRINSCKNKDISKYYNQLMIYILSHQNKKTQTINIIKYRWNYLQNKYKNNINIINENDKNG